MTDTEYLTQILADQNLGSDSAELKALIEHRDEVEELLRSSFPDSSPTIRYGGSRAKGTLIKESYDLDIVCYFENDDVSAGETLEDIFTNVEKALATKYQVQRKRSALRLRDSTSAVDFHVDVVPGRFTDDTKTDCYLWQAEGTKQRLKTNLDVHIAHVRDSGVVPAIRILKLWKARRALPVKQFAFELMIIALLGNSKTLSLPEQVKKVWTEISDRSEAVAIEDPANPTGNDLSDILAGVWWHLSATASDALATLEAQGWSAIFGDIEEEVTESVLHSAAATSFPSKPHGSALNG